MNLESRPTLSTQGQTNLDNLFDEKQPSISHTYHQSAKLVIKGDVIKLSEVVSNYISKYASFSELYIFASQEVLIDVSLIAPMKNVCIISPKWTIVGQREINLRGSNASPINRSQAGNPGEPGGNFIGVGDNFNNGHGLTIDVSGGNGGNGKDGEDGQDGQNGGRPSVPRVTIWHYIFAKDYPETRIEAEQKNGYVKVDHNKYKMFGAHGTPGSNGGNGGKPGYGAKPGQIYVTTESAINKLANPGKKGDAGKGGKGGNGGEHGKARIFKCTKMRKWFGFKFRFKYDNLPATDGDDGVSGVEREPVKTAEPQSPKSEDYASDGEDGVSGVAGEPVEATEPHPFVPVSTVLEQYKEYILLQNCPHFVEFVNRHISNIHN
jgi:hypothetical protein